jgi:hypothetical protein
MSRLVVSDRAVDKRIGDLSLSENRRGVPSGIADEKRVDNRYRIDVQADIEGEEVRTPQGCMPDDVRDEWFKRSGRPVQRAVCKNRMAPRAQTRSRGPSFFFLKSGDVTLKIKQPSLHPVGARGTGNAVHQ